MLAATILTIVMLAVPFSVGLALAILHEWHRRRRRVRAWATSTSRRPREVL